MFQENQEKLISQTPKKLSLKDLIKSSFSMSEESMSVESSQFDIQPSKIRDYLYLGSIDHASKFETLQQLNIKAILNLTQASSNLFPESFTYKNLPVNDICEENIAKIFLEAFSFIDNIKMHGEIVLVHCEAGVSRSATIVIAYLMKTYELSLDEAIIQVKEKRKCIAPNFGFMLQLQDMDANTNSK